MSWKLCWLGTICICIWSVSSLLAYVKQKGRYAYMVWKEFQLQDNIDFLRIRNNFDIYTKRVPIILG